MMSYSNENNSNSSAHMNNSTNTCLLEFFDSNFGDRNVFKGVMGYSKPIIVLLSHSFKNSDQLQMLVTRISTIMRKNSSSVPSTVLICYHNAYFSNDR